MKKDPNKVIQYLWGKLLLNALLKTDLNTYEYAEFIAGKNVDWYHTKITQKTFFKKYNKELVLLKLTGGI